MITQGYIFNKVMVYLKSESKFFTSAEIMSTIGIDSFRVIAEAIEFPKANFSGVMGSGVWTISVSTPGDFIKVDKAKDIVFSDAAGIRKLNPKTQKLIGRDQILSAIPGSPENYFLEDQLTLGVYPPSTSGTIVIPYVQRPTALSSTSDTNQLTEECYMASVFYTVQQCMMKDNDERAASYGKMYADEIDRLKRQVYGELFEEEKDYQPSQEYLR
jgi:hypothetical protein